MGVLNKLLDFGFDHIDIWRSEPMSLAQLMIPAESAHDTIEALGDVGLLEFKDLNPDKSAFQRTYASQVKRCDELARKLRFFKDQVEKSGVTITAPITDEEKLVQFDEVELRLEELEKELVELNGNSEKLLRAYSELNEMQQVLEKAGGFFDGKARLADVALERNFGVETDSPLLEGGVTEKVSKIGFIAGTIQRDKLNAFERLLFRATRGNLFLRSSEIEEIRDPASGEMQKKNVFVVFFAGERSRQKASKICDAFNANRYPFPDDLARQRQMLTEVTSRLRELHTTNEAGERRREAVVNEIARGLEGWTTLVRREKATFHIMNKLSLDVTCKVLIAEVWLPDACLGGIQDVLNKAAENSNTQLQSVIQTIATSEEPPTHYETNKFTECFQTIVEAYGVARYREVNPAVLTIMTFPFLFAVMFGDWGNAILMLLFAGFMLYKEKDLMGKDLGDMVGMLFGGRYCILLMGLYSIYTGFIYNEYFSMPTYIFGQSRFVCYNSTNQVMLYPSVAPPKWPANTTYPASLIVPGNVVDPRDCGHFSGRIAWPYGATPVVLGVDPMWHGRKTELPYMNSVKMKMSILIGVTHMNFGILMSLFNNMDNGDMLSTVCEFIPQMIFLNAIFGYLCVLIVVKWITASYADLYNVLIKMFLGLGDVLPQNQLFSGQKGVQQLLLALAFLSVPVMLLPKPLILKKRWEASQKAKSTHGSSVELTLVDDHVDEDMSRRPSGGHGSNINLSAKAEEHGGGEHGHGHGDHFDFGEVMVHQMIHTIEFVLGAVSNTASYLRLWALSLAHSQLSSVFWDRVLMMGCTLNPFFLFIAFYVYACAVLGVLMVMESLSAFLHALRLHWVEYMNKFYKGDGHKFAPFSFKLLLAEEEAETKA